MRISPSSVGSYLESCGRRCSPCTRSVATPTTSATNPKARQKSGADGSTSGKRISSEHSPATQPLHPINVALQYVAESKPLNADPFRRLIEANRLDQQNSRYNTFQDVLAYCNLSANPVGEMVLALWDIDTGTEEGRYRRDLSDATCTALQIANHWQDVRRDYLDADRIYLPQEDLRAFGLTQEDIAEGIRQRRCPDAFRTMMRFQVDRAEAWFRKGERLIDEVPPELAIDLRLFTDGGRAVLKAIERQNYDTLSRRPTVGNTTRAWLALRAGLKLKLT